MTKDKEPETDEKIVPMEKPSIEDTVNAIASQAVSKENFGQVVNQVSDQLEKLDLRLKLLEQKDYSFTDNLVTRIREMMVAELKNKE
jgi:hypothetical protein